MTAHAVRLFADDASVRRVGNGLLDRTLPRADWTHEAHLAACAWLIIERPEIILEKQLPVIIRRYNESVGGINDDTQGYHETLTQLYIAGVRNWLLTAAPVAPATLVDRVNALLRAPMGDRAWPLTIYSEALLFSVMARKSLVAPDVGAWPSSSLDADPHP